MGSPAETVAQIIHDNGVATLGSAFGWSLSVGTPTVSPDQLVSVTDTGGQGPDTAELDVGQPSVQVRVRGFTPHICAAKQEQIRALLLAQLGTVVDGVTVIAINVASDAAHLGQDDNDRELYTSNYRLITKQ